MSKDEDDEDEEIVDPKTSNMNSTKEVDDKNIDSGQNIKESKGEIISRKENEIEKKERS